MEQPKLSPVAGPLTIDVVSDIVCPWCFIGKRRLEAALDLIGANGAREGVAIRWHPFELNPGLPAEGIERSAYLEAKFGPGHATGIYDRVRAAGQSAGIPFAFDRIARQPNTRDAHRLVAWAQQRGDASALVEKLFAAYFLEGRNPGDRHVLSEIASASAFDPAAARAMLDSREEADGVEASERRAHEIGIGGVPFFIFNGRVAVSGAQEAQVLAEAIAESVRTPDPTAATGGSRQ